MYLRNIIDKVALEHVNRILENTFNIALAIKDFRRRKGKFAVHEIVVDKIDSSILRSGFQTQTRTIGKSQFIFQIRDPIAVLKKRFSLVGKMQIYINAYYECKITNSSLSGLGQVDYQFL